jgi:hypothetical protein
MKHVIGSAALVALLVAPLARAADDSKPPLLVPIGMSAMVGGGISQFIDPTANSNATLGGNWTARVTLGTRSFLGAEVAYLGTAQAINALGVDDHAYLLSTGLEGALRLNALTGAWQPYLTAGLGWRYFSVQNTLVNTSDVANTDNVLEMPLAVGLAYRNSGLIVDARADVRPSFYQHLMGATSLASWSVGAKVGFEF